MKQPFEVLRDRLSVYLGPNTTQTALKTFTHKSVGVAPKKLSMAQTLQLLKALQPMLKTLLNTAQCDRIVVQLGVKLDLHK